MTPFTKWMFFSLLSDGLEYFQRWTTCYVVSTTNITWLFKFLWHHMSNLIVKYSRAYLLHIYKAYGNTIINNTKQQQQLDLWCWTPYFVWPSEILMKYPFLVGDLSSLFLFYLHVHVFIIFFLQRRHEWHQSHPYDKCQSLWRITLIYSECEYCLPMKTVFFKIFTKFYV